MSQRSVCHRTRRLVFVRYGHEFGTCGAGCVPDADAVPDADPVRIRARHGLRFGAGCGFGAGHGFRSGLTPIRWHRIRIRCGHGFGLTDIKVHFQLWTDIKWIFCFRQISPVFLENCISKCIFSFEQISQVLLDLDRYQESGQISEVIFSARYQLRFSGFR